MKKSKISIILYVISALLLAAGVFLVIRQYVLIPGEYVPPEEYAAATATPGEIDVTPVPTPSATGTAAATPSPTPYVKPVPVRIYFTDVEVMCDIVPVGMITEGDRKGQMDTVDDPDLAAWYEPGPAPGEDGNAIINGHKSWKGKAGRFSVLWNMKLGDEVAIGFEDGSIKYFQVMSVEFYPYNDVPSTVMDMQSDTPRLTLITCYGDFDQAVGTSKQRCVVVCEPIEKTEDASGPTAE